VSLALRLTFRAADRTLTDGEVQTAMEAIMRALVAEHAAVQR
jgi:phenylalanyl-tRNA synthetase beta subunit